MRPVGLLTFARRFTDYRKFGELLSPTKVISHGQALGVVFTRTAVEFDHVDPRAFHLPVAIEAIAKGKIQNLR